MVAEILAKIGLPVLIDLVSGALRRVDHPSAQSASQALDNVQSALASGLISDTQMAEANRHAEAMAQVKQKEFEVSLSEINQSLRSEVASNDPYVRRMRPTFGYLMALTWAAQMFGLAYVVVFETDQAARVLEGMASLSSIWAVGLSVLGIYVYKRSEEKKSSLPFLRQEITEQKPKASPLLPSKLKVKSNINP